MTRRSIRYRGVGLTVEVPDRVGGLARRLRPRPEPPVERLVFADPPPVSVDTHEPERAKVRELVATAVAAPATAPKHVMDPIADHAWYHTIELPDGSVTEGRWDHRPLLPRYGLPDDLSGKRALDVGSGDGFWAFALEVRGADVTSLDIETYADVDLPPVLHDVFVDHPLDLSFRHGLLIAREELGSQVTLVNQPIYELAPEDVGTFDLVHAGDILLHLRDPALALQRLRAVTSGEALIVDLFDPELDGLGAGTHLSRYRGGWHDAQWWAPSLSTLVQMVADAGFSDVDVLTTYRLSDVDETPGWRAVIRARP